MAYFRTEEYFQRDVSQERLQQELVPQLSRQLGTDKPVDWKGKESRKKKFLR